jgi:hypothetical protein
MRYRDDRVEYIGHLIYAEGMHFTRAKLDSIARFEEPKTMFEVKHFLGLAKHPRNLYPSERFDRSFAKAIFLRHRRRRSDPSEDGRLRLRRGA